MPVTPFHLGPGAAFKAVLGAHFSFTVFAFSQVLIDIEPAARMLLDAEPLHPHLHTYLGATGVALASVWPGRPVCEWALRLWNAKLDPSQAHWLGVEPAIARRAAWCGAFIGTYSHVALDSVMHVDVRPWMPFADGNRLHGVLSIPELHVVCIFLGIAGLAALAARRLLRRGGAG